MILTGNNRSIDLAGRSKIMGIVNVTPDSFYDGGFHAENECGVLHGITLFNQGADILDIGGESTRPGADPVLEKDEINRTIPVIEGLTHKVNCPISIDTTKAKVASEALNAGANWVNDVSAGLTDPEILDVVAEWDVPYVAMHMRGTPATMQKDTAYDDLIDEIKRYFFDRLEVMEKAGVNLDKVILDPGIGFGKAMEHNYSLLGNLDEFRSFGKPLLVGPSRKSFLKLVGVDDVKERLPGTLAAVTLCAEAGVEVIRVHDVAEAVQVANVIDMVKKSR